MFRGLSYFFPPRRKGVGFVTAAAVLVVASLATHRTFAQESTHDTAADRSAAPSDAGTALGLWRVESMLEQACRNLTQRYNLSPEQEKYTRALMTRQVKAFLSRHEGDLRSLLTQWFKAQMGGTADAAMAKHWAETAKPIFNEAEKTILAGNEKWRLILNDEQRKIHDADLTQMQVTFKTLRGRFDRWEEGRFDRIRDGFATRRPKPRAAAEPPGQAGLTTVSRVVGTPYRPGTEHYWDSYVRRFIEDYDLDESQKQTALGILADCKEQATNYRQARAEETQKVQQKLRELSAAGSNSQARMEAYKELRALSKPVTDIFGEMRARLDAIPRPKQKAAKKKTVSERREAQLARMRERMEKRKIARSRVSPTSAPAETQPAALDSDVASPAKPKPAAAAGPSPSEKAAAAAATNQ